MQRGRNGTERREYTYKKEETAERKRRYGRKRRNRKENMLLTGRDRA
jgi:hypothetical protein